MQRRPRRNINSSFVTGGFINNTPPPSQTLPPQISHDYHGGQQGSMSQSLHGSIGQSGPVGQNTQGYGVAQNTQGSITKNTFSSPPPIPARLSLPQATNAPLTNAVEMSAVPAASTESLNTQITDGSLENEKKNYRKFFSGTNKKPSVRAKERRIRQNRRLRKVLIPKNALMSLHEVKGIKLTDFDITSRSEGGFSAKVTVNNMQYEGIGNSKISAKNNACEKALRDHVIFKMLQAPIKQEKSESENAAAEQEQDVEMKDAENDLLSTEEDEVPMLNLASFALFKLFLEWESEGFDIPEFRQQNNSNGSTPEAPAVVVKRSELPPNWETMHPTSLLCMMRPGIAYSYLGGEGTTPNTTQRVGVSVDGENFLGEARSRKLARRNAAVDACNKLFNTTFAKSI